MSSALKTTQRYRVGGRSILGEGGGLIFIYSCPHTVKTIDFKKINEAEQWAEHEYIYLFIYSTLPSSMQHLIIHLQQHII